MYLQRKLHIKRWLVAALPCTCSEATRTKALMQHSPNLLPATMLACTPTPTTFPASSSKALIYTRMMLAKSVSGQASTSSSPAATNIGAAATKPKALSFIRKAPASSTLYRQSSKDRQHRRKSGDEFRRGPTNSVLVCPPPACPPPRGEGGEGGVI